MMKIGTVVLSRAGSSIRLVRLKPQGPGPHRGPDARYNENFPPLWAPKFLEEKFAVFTRGRAFKPQSPEGPWFGPGFIVSSNALVILSLVVHVVAVLHTQYVSVKASSHVSCLWRSATLHVCIDVDLLCHERNSDLIARNDVEWSTFCVRVCADNKKTKNKHFCKSKRLTLSYNACFTLQFT